MSADDELTRLVDDPGAAPSALNALLRRGQADLPTVTELDVLAKAVLPLSAVGAAGAGGGLLGGGAAKSIALGALALAAAGGVSWVVLDDSGRAGPAPSRAAAPLASVTPPRVAPVAVSAEPAAETSPSSASDVEVERSSRESSRPTGGEPPTRAPQPGAIVSEAGLLERARTLLQRDPAAALQLVEEHRRRYPRGVLAQEREVIAIRAKKHLGRAGEAREQSERFDREFSDSVHREGLERETR